MANSNSLILLPPRHTAQSPQDSSSSKPHKPSSDGIFEQKLYKAQTQKQKVQIPAKKQVAQTPTKLVAPKPLPAKPVIKANSHVQEDSQEDTGNPKPTGQKTAEHSATAVDESEEKDSADTQDSKKLPVAAEQVVVADAVAKKAAPKPIKTVTTKSNQPTVDPKLANTNSANSHKTVKDATSEDESDSADTKATVTAVGEDEADTDGGDAADAEFGTGKIVAGGAAHKNAASASSADDSGSDADAWASAGEAALADAFSTTIATATGTSAGKSTAQSGVAAIGGGSTITPLTVPTSTVTAGSIGKTSSIAATPQAQFAEENHPRIITSIQGNLLPNGGTLQMRLDPPGLGSLQVTVQLKDGAMTASFQTSNDEATKLLSHSLGQLKSGLEAAGVSVDKIHVEQSTKQDSSGESDSDSKEAPQDQQQQAQQDQQRREMVQRMWRKLAGVGDPVDLVA